MPELKDMKTWAQHPGHSRLACGRHGRHDPADVAKRQNRPRPHVGLYVGDAFQSYNVFDFTLDRSRDDPLRFLQDYDQVLVADAYRYNGVVAGNQITRAGFWAHLRRKLLGAEKAAPEIAREAVERVRTLYAIEELTVFDTDGAIPIDNNVSEREMKCIVLNRKNFLLWGTRARGGRRRSWPG
jgi:Transposase IS66 family